MNRSVFICLAFSLFSCASEHEVTGEFQKVFDSLKYGDHNSFVAQHKDASSVGAFCSDEFKTVLAESKKGRSSEECARVKAADPDRVQNELPDEAKLALGIFRFVCEVPEGSCSEYGRRVLISELESGKWSNLTRFEINKVIGHPEFAIVYADFYTDSETPIHRSVKFEKVGQSWLVTEGLP